MIKHISVTLEDIAKGESGSFSSCPVALATRRALSLDEDAFMTAFDSYEPYIGVIIGDDWFMSQELPDILKWATDFDQGIMVHPIEFDVEFTEDS